MTRKDGINISEAPADFKRPEMPPTLLDSDRLKGLRKVRLYHWNCAINITAHVGRIELKPQPTRKHAVWVRKNTLSHLTKAHATHMTFVQILNQFFEIGDTAEKDAAK